MRDRGFSPEVIEAREHSGEDRASFDTLRSRVDISPLNRGGSNFKTHVLIEKSNTKVEYKPSIGLALFVSIFTCTGIIIMAFNLFPFINIFDNNANTVRIGLVLFGAIFAGGGGIMYYYLYKPRIFDKRAELFIKSYKTKLYSRNIDNSKNHIRLKDIVAIQLLGEYVQSDDSTYKSFELNLVLENGTRKNVVDHGNLKTIVKDARILSKFLNVPIWHAGNNQVEDSNTEKYLDEKV